MKLRKSLKKLLAITLALSLSMSLTSMAASAADVEGPAETTNTETTNTETTNTPEVIESEAEDKAEAEPIEPAEDEPEAEPVEPAEDEPETEPVGPAEDEPETEPVGPAEGEPETKPVEPAEGEPETEPVEPAEGEPETEPVEPAEDELEAVIQAIDAFQLIDDVLDSPETTDLSELLAKDGGVVITDTDGNPVDSLQIGQNYHITLKFAEGGVEGFQFATDGISLTYTLPSIFKVDSVDSRGLTVSIDGTPTPIGTYSVSADGVLTVTLSEEGREALKGVYNATLTFEMDAEAQAGKGGDGSGSGKVQFGKDFTFELVDQPRVSMEKLGKYVENENHAGGVLEYTVQVTVDHGDVEDAVIEDVLTPPQSEALKLAYADDISVEIIRDDETITLNPTDYELIPTEPDPNNPFAPQIFRVELTGEAYNPLKLGDVLNVTYKYNVEYVPGTVDTFWGNVLNTATFTGTMPVEAPDGSGDITNVPVEETRNSSVEVRATPTGHGVIYKEQEYSEATKTLHYTLYTVVPAGIWTPLYIYDDMYTQYEGQKWYLEEFGGKVKDLTVSAVDVPNWFDWDESTDDSEKIADMRVLKSEAAPLTGYQYTGYNVVPEQYRPDNKENYLYYFADKSLYIIFGDVAGKDWGNWGSWDYRTDRLIITEYNLDMSATDPMTLYDINDAGKLQGTRALTPEEVLKAGITNNVNLRYDGYFPGYSVFFNNNDQMNKTGVLNKAEGTIDYTVTINTTDSTVRGYFHDVVTEWYALSEEKHWDNRAMWDASKKAVFYDKLPDGWEYVPYSLYVVTRGQWGAEDKFDSIKTDFKPLNDDGNISVPLVAFYRDPDQELFNKFSDAHLEQIAFHYTLKATDQWKKDHSTANEPTYVLNHAEIKDSNSTHWDADEIVPYYPAKLTKKAEQVDDTNLLRFTIKINPYGDDFLEGSDDLIVTDESTNLDIRMDTIEVKGADGNPVEFEKLPVTETGHFQLRVPDSTALTITYDALIKERGAGVPVSNKASIEGVELADSGYETELQVNNIWGNGGGKSWEMTVEKTDSESGKLLSGAKFDFYFLLSGKGALKANTKLNGRDAYKEDDWSFTTGENGSWTVGWMLEPGNYYALVETEAPEGYELDSEPTVFYYGFANEMDTEAYPNAVAVVPGGTLHVTNEPEPTHSFVVIPNYDTSIVIPNIPGEPEGGTPPPTTPGGETPTTPPSEDIPDNPPPLTDLPDEEPPLEDLPEEEPPLSDISDGETLLEDLPDEETPLTELPEEEPPLADIPEPDVPMAFVPQTGDVSLLWVGLTLMSGLSLAGLALTGKRKEEQ